MQLRYGLLCAVFASWGWMQPGAHAATPQARQASLPAPVTIHVTVTDKAGNPVTGLQKSDFTLLDDEHSSPIQAFATAESAPPLVVLVEDQVNEPFRALTLEQEQLEHFVSQNGGHLPFPVSLIFLTDSGLQQIKATTDGNALNAVLAKHHADLRAIDATNELYNGEARFQISLRALETILDYEAGYPGRKLLVWISQGWPTLDMPDVMLSIKEQKNIFGMVVTTSNLLRFTNTTMYSVDPEGNYDVGSMHTVDWQQFVKPVSRFDKVQYGDLATQVLAEQSGGLVRVGSNNTAQDVSHCVQDASGGYDLTFQPQASDKPNTWHSLRVKVEKRGMTVRTLDGYFAQP
jgi:VWFA-related protein